MKPGIAVSTLKTAIGQFFGLLLGAAAVKLLAVIAGPSGVGLYSVLRQLQQMLSSFASLGGQNALVQGLSSHLGKSRQQFLLSSFYMFSASSMVLSISILAFADVIAAWIFEGEHASAIRWLVVPIVLGAFLFFFRGILTAEMYFGALAIVNVLTGLGAVLVAPFVGLAFSRGYPEMLVLLIGGGLAPGLIAAFFFVRRLGYFQGMASLAFSEVTWGATSRFLHVALPSLLSSLLTLGSLLIVRAYVVRLYDLEGAGHFDAAWSISVMYLAVFLASLQSYLLPALSQSARGQELHAALTKAFHFSLLISLPLIVCLVIAKPLVLRILFSSEFLPSLDVLRWSLLGDFVRVPGWIMTTALLARADMKGFVFAEGLWGAVFMLSSAWLLPFGIEWVGLAYLVSYVFYLAFLVWRLWSAHGVLLSATRLFHWLAGFVLVVMTALICWNDKTLNFWHVLLVVPPLLFSFFIMRNDERIFARQLLIRSLLRLKRLVLRR